MTYYLAELPYPAPAGWAIEAVAALQAAVDLERHGRVLAAGPATLLTRWNEQTDKTKCFVLALEGEPAPDLVTGRFGLPVAADRPGRLLGAGYAALLLRDNQHLVDDCFIQVASDRRRCGIGSALWRELRRVGVEAGRSTFIAFSDHLPEQAAELPVIVPPTGVGSVPLDGPAQFARACGFTLEQTERQSNLGLPLDADLQQRLEAEAAAAGGAAEFEVRSWVGPTPDDLLAGVAAMQTALSVDAPAAGIDWRPEDWDAERQRREDAVNARSGVGYGAVALHRATGEVAGYTLLFCEFERPGVAYQWNTVVAQRHRGHRLWLRLKLANLRNLADHDPSVTSVITWNAGENDSMLAINTALGFRLESVEGAWQLVLA